LNLIKAEGPQKLSGTEKNQIIPIFIIDHKNDPTLCIVVIKKFIRCFFALIKNIILLKFFGLVYNYAFPEKSIIRLVTQKFTC